jgi:hypothetical protein
MDTVNSRDSYRSRLFSSISASPRPKHDFHNCDGIKAPVSLPVISSAAQTNPEPEDSEDTTLHYAPSAGDLTACVSWYNCSSLTVPNIIKISLLPVVSAPCASTLAPSRSDIPVSSRPFVVHSLSTNTSESLKKLFSRNQNSRRTTDPRSTDYPLSLNIVTSRATKSSINLTEDFEPVLDMSFSSSSIEPRSIVSYGIMGTLGRGTYGKVLLAYLKKCPDGDLYAVKMLRKNEMVQYSTVSLAGELNTLQMVAEASSVEHMGEDSAHGGLFLQRLADHFQNDRFHFIVLVSNSNKVDSRYLIRVMIIGISSYYIIGPRNSLSLPHSRTDAFCLDFSTTGW